MCHFIEGKNVTLGVTGGIAAYKSIELLRLLTKAGARVRVIMTENARWFVGPGTFQALSGQPVCTSVFDEGDAAIRHIDWAQSTDLAVIAPATANCIGKLAGGIADDALSTYMLAVTAPVVICPAMNTNMYAHPAVQRNLDILRGYGHFIVEPDAGQLACGTEGPGRLPDPAYIVEKLAAVMAPDDFAGRTILVTAGPTREAIDPVRFISNPSSGKMGFAIANAARQRGARVKLVCGPVALADPVDVEVHRVDSTRAMHDRVMSLLDDVDIVIRRPIVLQVGPQARIGAAQGADIEGAAQGDVLAGVGVVFYLALSVKAINLNRRQSNFTHRPDTMPPLTIRGLSGPSGSQPFGAWL